MTLSAVSHLSSIILSAKSAWLRWKTALTLSAAAAAASWHLQHLSKICWKEIQCLQINVKSQAEICFVPSFDFPSLELFHSKVGQQYKMIWFYTIQNDSIQYDNIYNTDNIRHKTIRWKKNTLQKYSIKKWSDSKLCDTKIIRYQIIPCEMIEFKMIWYDTKRYDTKSYDVKRYNMKQYSWKGWKIKAG